MRMNRLFVLVAAMVVVLAACSSSGTSSAPSAAAPSAAPSAAASAASAAPSSAAPSEAAKAEVRIGSDNFYESKLMAELYAQALEHAGYTVTRQFGLGSPDARPGLHEGPGRPRSRVRRLRPRLLRQDPGHRRR
jgi:glycine betaine/choline ABC-type transport system substrate-binding protein